MRPFKNKIIPPIKGMLLFSIEYYHRVVVVFLFPVVIEDVSSHTVTVIETITLARLVIGDVKAVWRMRYWPRESRLGIEWKWKKAAVQEKIGVYSLFPPAVWARMRRVASFLRRKFRRKHRNIWSFSNLRATLDSGRRLELKFHSKTI